MDFYNEKDSDSIGALSFLKKFTIFVLLLSNEICSNYISHVVVFNAIFRLAVFVRTFGFSPQKRDKHVEPGGL